jgi:hypothetical protein
VRVDIDVAVSVAIWVEVAVGVAVSVTGPGTEKLPSLAKGEPAKAVSIACTLQ